MTKPNLNRYIIEENRRYNAKRLKELPSLIDAQQRLLNQMDKTDALYLGLQSRLEQNKLEYQERLQDLEDGR
jgi:hypothetical protein